MPEPFQAWPTAQVDGFARDHLPPMADWPAMNFDRPELQYPARLNAAVELLDRTIALGHGPRPCLRFGREIWTYADLRDRADRIARVLAEDCGVRPGARVLLRGANHPMMVASWFAVLKAGAIAVATMPLLRARELAYILDKARVSLALCDARLLDELAAARETSPVCRDVIAFNSDASDSLEARMRAKPPGFAGCPTFATDVALIAFTSGTTGPAKGTVHFHRDVMAISDCFPRSLLRATQDDVFCGSPPLAFTFGLGGLVVFPMRIGASTALAEKATPDLLPQIIRDHRASVVFTAPTAYRAMSDSAPRSAFATLRRAVSAGEYLPLPTWQRWKDFTGLGLIDGLGATEMLHIFISSADDGIRPGATGRAIPGYAAKIVDEEGREVPDGTIGRLAVRGPTGCRYLGDPERQRRYVQDGWNLTGDAFRRDADGYFWFQSRTDDMIISAGYNISGPEVESVLLEHEAVRECAVVGAPDSDRGMIVKAFVVPRDPARATPETAKALQDFVKATIAPYKYPRAVEFLDALPRTETGKVQRYRLRDRGAAD